MIGSTVLLACALLLGGCGGGRTLVPGRIVVSFDADVTEPAGARIIENNGLSVIGGGDCVKSRGLNPFDRHVFLDVAVPFGEEFSWRARLKRIPGVESAKPCYDRIKE